MSMWDNKHEFGFELLGPADDFDQVLFQTQRSDSSAVLKRIGLKAYIFCDGKTAAMMCKVRAGEVKMIRPPQ